jgi:hypothetical protein
VCHREGTRECRAENPGPVEAKISGGQRKVKNDEMVEERVMHVT